MNPAQLKLESLLCVASDDAERLRLMLALATELQEMEPTQGYEYSRQAVALATERQDVRALAEAEMCSGQNIRVKQGALSAIPFFDSAALRFEALGDSSRQAYALYYLGGSCAVANMLEIAQQHISRAGELFEQLGDRHGPSP
jgi:hypothetical protein